MSSEDEKNKDIIDKFFDFCEMYKDSGVRFFAVIVCFFALLIFGTAFAPAIIRLCRDVLPFTVEFIQLSPLDAVFNYCKIGFFVALLYTLPLFIYQFGKLKVEKETFEEKTNRMLAASALMLIMLVASFLTYKFIFPMEIMFLYGFNFNVARFASSLSAAVSTFIFTLLMVVILILLPFLRYLIKKSLFFNYSELVSFKKPVMVYAIVFAAIIALPLELITLALVFLAFVIVYRILIIFARTR